MATPGVRERMAKLCVGLGAAADVAEGGEIELVRYFTTKFSKEPSLPFVAWMTHDWKFVHGFAGGRTRAQFLKDLEIVEASPLVPATRKVEARLRELTEKADGLAEAGKWAELVKLGKAGAALPGRCDARTKLGDLVQESRDWADDQMYEVIQALAAGGKAGDAKSKLKNVAKIFEDEPEAAEASTGLRAVAAFRKASRLEGEKAESARGAAKVEFAGTRWFDLFETK